MDTIRILPAEDAPVAANALVAPVPDEKTVAPPAEPPSHINIMFIDANFCNGRISEIAYAVITSNTGANGVKKTDVILNDVLERTGYKYETDSVVVINPNGFVSNAPGHEFGANIEDIIKDMNALMAQCHHVFVPEEIVFTKIKDEIQLLITAKVLTAIDVLPFNIIQKSSFTSRARDMVEAVGMRVVTRGPVSLIDMYQNLFGEQIKAYNIQVSLDALDLSRQLNKMASCFLHLIQNGGVIYLNEDEVL